MQIDLLPDIGSDHLPIFFRLCLKDDASERKVAPVAPPATRANLCSPGRKASYLGNFDVRTKARYGDSSIWQEGPPSRPDEQAYGLGISPLFVKLGGDGSSDVQAQSPSSIP